MALLEVIASCVDDVYRIVEGGGDRIELVSGFTEGGLTPSIGLIRASLRAAGDVPVMVMIRPHARGFRYSRGDLELMGDDIDAARGCGAKGVVFGALDENGGVDHDAMELLVCRAVPMEVTFHRAVDETPNPAEAIAEIRRYPAVVRVLTSGGQGNILENAAVLNAMYEAAGGALRIMAGGGVSMQNIARIDSVGGRFEYHVGKTVREGGDVLGRVIPEKVRRCAELAAKL